jgi:RNA polymerase sigma-70 factor (ECF subfamily)
MQRELLKEAGPDKASADSDLVRRAIVREPAAISAIMQKYNRRLFRIARSILRDETEAEDALQDAYVQAFTHLGGFRGDAAFSTWLSRIVVNAALQRMRRRRGAEISLDAPTSFSGADIIPFPLNAVADDPERTMAQREILQVVEHAIDHLPETFRTVLVARLVEGLSIEETAELLSIRPETVKTRLFRGRALLREQIDRQIDPVLLDAFPFAGWRCERLGERVLHRLGLQG